MRPISAFAHLMSSTVQIQDQTGVDGYGKPTFGAAVTYTAHIGKDRTIIRTPSGQTIESKQSIWLNGSPAVLETAKLTMSTGDVGSTEATRLSPPIVSVARLSDRSGPHHTVLYL